MRRLLFHLLVFCMTMSCIESQTDNDIGMITDPLSECIVPSSAYCGAEVILQWNGFADDAAIVLRSLSGNELNVDVEVVTDSGLIFHIPYSAEPGVYELYIIQGGEEYQLDNIEILPPLIPVSGISLPSACLAGEIIIIKGIGFKPSSTILLVGKDGLRYELKTIYEAGGLSVVVPSDMPEGDYYVYLLQEGNEWVISEILSVMALSAKKLASVAYQGPYIGSAQVRYTWSVVEGDPLRILLTETFVEEDMIIDEGSSDEYTAVSEDYFELTHDGFESSNDLSMKYTRDSEGKVKKAEVLIYGNSHPTDFTWSYEDNGYLLDITYLASNGKRFFRELAYDQGNLVRFRNLDFVYDDTLLNNHPSAPDVVWGYMAVMEKFDPFIYFPYLLGWYDEKSSCLPTAIVVSSGAETITFSFEYIFDEDGYVTEMKWNDGGVCKIIFSYR